MLRPAGTRASVLALLWLVLMWDQPPIADSPSDHGSSASGAEAVHHEEGRAAREGEVTRQSPAPAAAPDAESARIRLEPEPNLHAGGDLRPAR